MICDVFWLPYCMRKKSGNEEASDNGWEKEKETEPILRGLVTV